jgi:hypothetical protein
MVRRVTKDSGGNAAMQLGFGKLGNAMGGQRGSVALTASSSSDRGNKKSHLFMSSTNPHARDSVIKGPTFVNPLMVSRAAAQDENGMTINPLAKSRAARVAATAAKSPNEPPQSLSRPGESESKKLNPVIPFRRRKSSSETKEAPSPTPVRNDEDEKDAAMKRAMAMVSSMPVMSAAGAQFRRKLKAGVSSRSIARSDSEEGDGLSVDSPGSPAAASPLLSLSSKTPSLAAQKSAAAAVALKKAMGGHVSAPPVAVNKSGEDGDLAGENPMFSFRTRVAAKAEPLSSPVSETGLAPARKPRKSVLAVSFGEGEELDTFEAPSLAGNGRRMSMSTAARAKILSGRRRVQISDSASAPMSPSTPGTIDEVEP